MTILIAIYWTLAVVPLACLVSSTAARLLAAVLLAHAHSLDALREARRDAWRRWSRELVPDVLAKQ